MHPYLIETDLGHDPDDLFCLCHLAETGLPIAAVGLVPGSPEQVALAYHLRRHLGLNFLIGTAKDTAKNKDSGVHRRLMERLGWTGGGRVGPTEAMFARALDEHPEAQCLVIGPAPGLGRVASRLRGRLTFQGGFLPYHLHMPTAPVEKFVGQEAVPTFNFNGDRKSVDALLRSPLAERRFCGKNICHGVVLTRDRARRMAPARNAAGDLYRLAVELYFDLHAEKKLHDPTALVCHLHPGVGTWFRGRPQRSGAGWTTVADPAGDFVLADVDHDALWDHLLHRT